MKIIAMQMIDERIPFDKFWEMCRDISNELPPEVCLLPVPVYADAYLLDDDIELSSEDTEMIRNYFKDKYSV